MADKSETYRILPLSYGDSQTPNQVAQLNANFFGTSSSPNWVERSNHMLPNFYSKDRVKLLFPSELKDFATSPLRLGMLCYIWKLWEEHDRPTETDVKLFERLVEKFYDLQQPKFLINKRQRRELELVLGKLALWAFDQPISRSLIRLDQIPESLVQTLGYVDEPGSLLHLALELCLLVTVGQAAENPNERVYAFFHPTFQEYFAAITIPNRHFFLPRDHIALARAGKIQLDEFEHYRFLNVRWFKVILLWLEREDVASYEKLNYLFSLADISDKLSDSDNEYLRKFMGTISAITWNQNQDLLSECFQSAEQAEQKDKT